jgi:putative ABC transport system permease protein
VGKSITLNGKAFDVAGVLPRGFTVNAEVLPSEGPLDKVDIFLPLPLGADAEQRRGDENYNIVVRLKPNVSVQQAQADIDIIASRIRTKDKRDVSFGMDVIGLQRQVVGDVRRTLLVLLGSVALVLLIACANVANLLLARAAGKGSRYPHGSGSRLETIDAATIDRERPFGTAWGSSWSARGASQPLGGTRDESRQYSPAR